MLRHTLSPIWYVALLFVACADDSVQPTSPQAPTLEEVSALPETAVFASPSARALDHHSALAPELPPTTLVDEGDLRVVTGFERPSAVLYDPDADCYLVSNLGDPAQGAYISKVDPEGDVLEERWIDGAKKGTTLTQPRAMVVWRNRLYVADGGYIRVFDRQSGVRRGAIRVPGATQLSGLALDTKGALIATDAAYDEAGRALKTDAVYRINRAGRASALFRSSVLGHPVAVAKVGSTVWIATGGSGKLYGLKRGAKLIQGPAIDEGRLSGMVQIGPRDVVVTSRVAQGVYRGDLEGRFEYVGGGITEPGHPAWDPGRGRLIVPSQDRGELRVLLLAERP